MPVDYPDAMPGAVRRAPPRLLIIALSFLITLGALLALRPLLDMGAQLS